MFSRSKDKSEATPLIPAAPQPAPSSSKRSGGPRAAPSIISTDLIMNGTLVSTGDIQIDGKIEGDIRTTSLTVGDKAFVHGEICADEVIVRGKVMGTIRARRVQLASTCHVEGNILHEALAVEAGAFFEGHCRHSADPLNEQAPATDVRSKPAMMASSVGATNGAMGAGPVIVKPAPQAANSPGSPVLTAVPVKPATPIAKG
jgi:cytoskeletal protein CcmA (bactofilin family)